MLWSDNRLDDICQIVDVREGFHTEKDVIEGCLLAGCVFRTLND